MASRKVSFEDLEVQYEGQPQLSAGGCEDIEVFSPSSQKEVHLTGSSIHDALIHARRSQGEEKQDFEEESSDEEEAEESSDDEEDSSDDEEDCESDSESEDDQETSGRRPRTRGTRTMMEKCNSFRVIKSPAFQDWGRTAQMLKQEVPIPKQLRFRQVPSNGTDGSSDDDTEIYDGPSAATRPSTSFLGPPLALARALSAAPPSPTASRGAESCQEDTCSTPHGGMESFVRWPPARQSFGTTERRRSACRRPAGRGMVLARRRSLRMRTTAGLCDVIDMAMTTARKKRAAQLCATQMLRSFTQRTQMRGEQMRCDTANVMANRQKVRNEANAFQGTYARCVDELEATELSFRRPKRAHSIALGELFFNERPEAAEEDPASSSE